MSVATEPQPAPAVGDLPPAPRGSLVKAEIHRFRARRFIQVMVGIGVLGWVVAAVIGLLNFGTPTDADFADAQAQLEQVLAEQEGFRQECLADPGIPEGTSPEEWCGPPLTEENFGGPEQFLDKAPFDFAGTGTDGALAFAALSAILAFVIGATWIGAEWSTRSLVALLFWVPRRLQVVGTKLAVLVGGAALLGVAAQLGWLAMSGLWRAFVGTDAPLPDDFWSQLLQTQGRGVLLTVLAAVFGFGLTNLVRNTGAALGIAFVYVAIAETAIRALRPYWDPFLLSSNAIGLVQQGGYTIFIFDDQNIGPNGEWEPVEYFLGHLQSGLLLGAVAVVLVGLGAWLFARRDIH
jgi:hypothetical protein